MLRLAIFLSFTILCQGLVRHTIDLSGFDDNDVSSVNINPRNGVRVEGTPIYVMDLNTEDLDLLTLRIGSRKEAEDFERAFGANIRRIERTQRSQKTATKEEPKKEVEKVDSEESIETRIENAILKREIVKLLNKLILSTTDSSDTVNGEGSTLSLYIKGAYTSLTARSGNKQWHIFIRPPSPLPAWFYSAHPADVTLPTSLRNPFYKALLNMLQVFLGLPV